jgi:hypothetical protein
MQAAGLIVLSDLIPNQILLRAAGTTSSTHWYRITNDGPGEMQIILDPQRSKTKAKTREPLVILKPKQSIDVLGRGISVHQYSGSMTGTYERLPA